MLAPCHPAGDASAQLYEAPWSCTYHYYGCDKVDADNYESFITMPIATMCQYRGCNDTEAINYNSKVSTLTGCQAPVHAIRM